MRGSTFSDKLLNWYAGNQRDLPWRHTQDPYKIWLSEIILQQTRVKQGLPYFQQFVKNYPNVQALAQAAETEVLRLWQGLGYYTRARNLHATAQYIAYEKQGKFPKTYPELLALKGVGSYTAAAIASFAFNEFAAVVDGNVYRVLARVYGIAVDISTHKGKEKITKLAWQLLPKSHPGRYNQAIMEFGAVQCTPSNPACLFCIMTHHCQARKMGKQRQLPIKSKKIKLRDRFFHYYVIMHNSLLIMKKRTKNDIWQGLYDFPSSEYSEMKSPQESLEGIEKIISIKGVGNQIEIYPYTKRTLTHQRIFARFIWINIPAKFARPQTSDTRLQWFTIEQTHQLPKPILVHNFFEKNIYQ